MAMLVSGRVFFSKSIFWKSLTKTTLFTAFGLSSKGFFVARQFQQRLGGGLSVYPHKFHEFIQGVVSFGWIDLVEAQLAVWRQ